MILQGLLVLLGQRKGLFQNKKNAFYFTAKAFFTLEVLNFCHVEGFMMSGVFKDFGYICKFLKAFIRTGVLQ